MSTNVQRSTQAQAAAAAITSAAAAQGARAGEGLGTQSAPGPVLPNSSLFKVDPTSNTRYLVETDPRFASYRQWLSSDYLLQALAYDPVATQKRLGDGFYEQKLIREQVAALTGYRYLGDYRDDQEQYMALMSAGVTFAKAQQLRPGIALSAAQIAQLTSDIVWLVSQEVTLADGSRSAVLVPQIYLSPKRGDLGADGQLFGGASKNASLISARDIELALSGDINNSGSIIGRRLLDISAKNISNTGVLQGDVALLKAQQDINIQGGQVLAHKGMSLQAGGDLNITSTTAQGQGAAQNGRFSSTNMDRIAGLYVSGPAGVLLAAAGNNINLTAAQIGNAGTGRTQLSGGNNINLSTLQTASSTDVTHDSRNYARVQMSQEVGTQISGQGAMVMVAQNDITARAADINAQGALSMVSVKGNVNIEEGRSTYQAETASHAKTRGLFSSTTVTQKASEQSNTAQASEVGGASVDIRAGGQLSIKGSNVLADQDLSLVAGGGVSITAAQNSQSSSRFEQTSKSGMFSNGGLSVSIGKQEQSLSQKSSQTTAAASTVGSIAGNVRISAGDKYSQIGSDVLAAGGDIDISAKQVEIKEARQSSSQSTEQTFKQSGLTVGLSGGVINTAQATMQGIQGVTGGGSNRSKALNAVIAYGKGADLYEQGRAVVDAYDKNGVMGNTGADGKANPGVAAASGIKVNISMGSTSSQSNSSTVRNTGAGSTVKAAGSVSIKATGQGPGEGDLNIQGSKVQAAQNLTLSAVKDVNILASADTETNRSSNHSSAAGLGVSFGVGAGSAGVSVDISASRGKGQANADSTSYTNSHITAGQQVHITSGANTNVIGGHIKASQVVADIGGSLNIESLQDTATSNASQNTKGVALSIPTTGAGGSASMSQSKQRSNSNYDSVGEQSGIQAGAGGFQINVKNHTNLTGAVIESAAGADKNTLSTHTLSTSDIQNSMSASASSSGTSVGTDMLDGKYAAGTAVAANALNKGSANQSDVSTTTTAISAARVTVNGKTTDTSKDALTDSNGKTVSTDTSNTNRTLAKPDVAGLQQQAQQEQADNMLLFKAAVTISDPINRAMTADKKIILQTCQADGKCEQKQIDANDVKIGPDGRVYVFNNGIMNTEPQALDNAAKKSSPEANQRGVYVIINPYTGNVVSEIIYAGIDKLNEIAGAVLPISNAARANIDVRNATQAQGGQVIEVDHSRGSLTSSIATAEQINQGTSNAPIKNVTFYGGAANAQRMADRVDAVTGGIGIVQQATHKDDKIGTLIGGNAPTGGRDASTGAAHTNYGPGVKIERRRNVWGVENGSVPVVVPPSRLKRGVK